MVTTRFLLPRGTFSGTRRALLLFLGALWEGAGCGHSHRASPFFSLGSLCVSGTRRGAPSGGGRPGSSSDFPRLNGCLAAGGGTETRQQLESLFQPFLRSPILGQRGTLPLTTPQLFGEGQELIPRADQTD